MENTIQSPSRMSSTPDLSELKELDITIEDQKVSFAPDCKSDDETSTKGPSRSPPPRLKSILKPRASVPPHHDLDEEDSSTHTDRKPYYYGGAGAAVVIALVSIFLFRRWRSK